MRFDDGTRTRIYADMTLDLDPTGSTIELEVDGVWHPATWQGTPVEAGGKWMQTARTTGYFAGPTVVAAGATVLAAGRRVTRTRVSIGGDILTRDSSPIDVA